MRYNIGDVIRLGAGWEGEPVRVLNNNVAGNPEWYLVQNQRSSSFHVLPKDILSHVPEAERIKRNLFVGVKSDLAS